MTTPAILPSDGNPSPPANAPGTSGAASGSATPPEPFRFGPNAPEYARGRTAEEILALTESLAGQVASLQAAKPAPTAPAFVAPTPQEWMEKPNEAAQRVADARMQTLMSPAMATVEGLMKVQAQTVRSLAAQQFADDFRRWAPEIDGHVGTLAPEHRTLDNIEKIVKYVRGNHFEELATERAQQIVAQGGLGERSGGNGSFGVTPSGVNLDALPEGMREEAKRQGLTIPQVQEMCKKWNITPESWMAMTANHKVFTSTGPLQMTMTDEALGITRQFGE